LVFHDIGPKEVSLFDANLRFLKAKTNVISMDKFISGDLSCRKINTIITFDDGYRSWIRIAAPLLRELELPATFFISSGFVGLREKDEKEFLKTKLGVKGAALYTRGCLTKKEVRMLANEGFTIGGHTVTHTDLAKLADRRIAKTEIVRDKNRLEQLIGKSVEYFAYPNGSYMNPFFSLERILKESGYLGAVTTAPGFNINNGSTNYFFLNRDITSASMPNLIFRALVNGNHDAVSYIRKRAKMILGI
jgi:peptidoglycan/xylan/chitin deacetylase (PgdA/CDA1 family)